MNFQSLIDLRLDGIKNSCQRARVAFFVLILSACSITVVLYNEHFAWNRRLLDDNRGFTQWPPPGATNQTGATNQAAPVTTPPVPALSPSRDSAGELAKEKRVEIVKNSEDNTNIKLDLLGIRLGSADLTFFGSIAMLVVSIYFFLCSRRASDDIRSLLAVIKDPQRAKQSESDVSEERLKAYVLAGITQSLVLTVVPEKNRVALDSAASPRLLGIVRASLSLLTYFPAFAIAGIILGDLEFAFFRNDVPSKLWVLKNLHWEYSVQFILLDLMAVVLMAFVWNINRLTNRYQSAAGAAVQQFEAAPATLPADIGAIGKGQGA